MILNKHLSPVDLWILGESQHLIDDWKLDLRIGLRSDPCLPKYPGLMAKCHFYDEDFGEWHLFGGCCIGYAIIRASSLGDACDIYLDEYGGSCEMEDGTTKEELEYGTFTSSGKWFSEATTSFVVALNLNDYEFYCEIKSGEGVPQ